MIGNEGVTENENSSIPDEDVKSLEELATVITMVELSG